jgi:hypothetical protein
MKVGSSEVEREPIKGRIERGDREGRELTPHQDREETERRPREEIERGDRWRRIEAGGRKIKGENR